MLLMVMSFCQILLHRSFTRNIASFLTVAFVPSKVLCGVYETVQSRFLSLIYETVQQRVVKLTQIYRDNIANMQQEVALIA